jgi:uncharacterized membrane protein YbhN (UPF0104 family)
VLAVVNRSTIAAGSATLAGADLGWLGLAAALTTALWVAGTAAQLGAVPIRPRLTELFVVQVAAGFVNHVVPGGVGGMTVNVRYLQRSGMTRPAALASVGLNSVATLVTHLALVAALWAMAPAVLPVGVLDHALARPISAVRGLAMGASPEVLVTVPVLLLALAAWVMALGSARRRDAAARARGVVAGLARNVRQGARSLLAVLGHPGRATLLWAGSAASPALHALILVAVYHSMTGALGWVTVAMVYLVASSVAALVPSPGGFGSLDVALIGGLVAVGASTTTAVAVVLGYRLLTVWLPLVPGALVFAVLLHRSRL